MIQDITKKQKKKTPATTYFIDISIELGSQNESKNNNSPNVCI